MGKMYGLLGCCALAYSLLIGNITVPSLEQRIALLEQQVVQIQAREYTTTFTSCLHKGINALQQSVHSIGAHAPYLLGCSCAAYIMCQVAHFKYIERWLAHHDRWSAWEQIHLIDHVDCAELETAVAQHYEEAYKLSPLFAYQLLLKDINKEITTCNRYHTWVDWIRSMRCTWLLQQDIAESLVKRCASLKKLKEVCLKLLTRPHKNKEITL